MILNKDIKIHFIDLFTSGNPVPVLKASFKKKLFFPGGRGSHPIGPVPEHVANISLPTPAGRTFNYVSQQKNKDENKL